MPLYYIYNVLDLSATFYTKQSSERLNFRSFLLLLVNCTKYVIECLQTYYKKG